MASTNRKWDDQEEYDFLPIDRKKRGKGKKRQKNLEELELASLKTYEALQFEDEHEDDDNEAPLDFDRDSYPDDLDSSWGTDLAVGDEYDNNYEDDNWDY